MLPVGVNVPVAGSYTSALASGIPNPPPAIKTPPSASKTALC
jgi:hypothetical protein